MATEPISFTSIWNGYLSLFGDNISLALFIATAVIMFITTVITLLFERFSKKRKWEIVNLKLDAIAKIAAWENPPTAELDNFKSKIVEMLRGKIAPAPPELKKTIRVPKFIESHLIKELVQLILLSIMYGAFSFSVSKEIFLKEKFLAGINMNVNQAQIFTFIVMLYGLLVVWAEYLVLRKEEDSNFFVHFVVIWMFTVLAYGGLFLAITFLIIAFGGNYWIVIFSLLSMFIYLLYLLVIKKLAAITS